MKALVTGATGFVGTALLRRLERPRVLTRDPARAKKALGGIESLAWDPERGPPPPEAFKGIDAVIHLAGEPVAGGRWTEKRKRRIRDSRVIGTRHLVDGILAANPRPRVLVSASAVGFYGDRGDEMLTEDSRRGTGFLADVCAEWEREARRADEEGGVRTVSVRIGVVLGKGGGALAKMLLPFKLGLGSPLGSGKQWMPWIHVDDLVGILLFCANDERMRGAVNGVAPAPATNRDFTKALGRALGRPTFLPAVPAGVLRLGMGEFAQVLLDSQRIGAQRAWSARYAWLHTDLEGALRAATR
ncbi:MAG TPA: TIGR01777 family oxidoreductase [Planctomycetota bacterium]|nr:TIGR01777 family oxidoreductase [Planctomycetota bacterium]